jgi:pimeloyl-ACP methyl ester carboxylesterase
MPASTGHLVTLRTLNRTQKPSCGTRKIIDVGEHARALLGEPRQTMRAGCRIGYRVSGTSGPAILLFSAWQIVHSPAWRAQVPALSRHARVITVDCIGNGRSDRPQKTWRYHPFELVADALAVLDAEKAPRAQTRGWAGRRSASLGHRYPPARRGVLRSGQEDGYGAPACSRFALPETQESSYGGDPATRSTAPT